jgi:hypothetical protein
MTPAPSDRPLRLRDLPCELKLVLAIFLVMAGVGYGAALVQVHYQSAGKGELLPGPATVRERYSGPAEPPRSKIVKLIEADHGPFNSAGTMRPAFTEESRGWKELVRSLAPEELARLTADREGERLALLAWARSGGDRSAYDRDDYALGPDLAGQPVTADLLAGPGRVKIRTLIVHRCAECHSEKGRMESARRFPLDTYEGLKPYLEVTAATSRMELPRLAQTTHAHLFGLSLLYAATGVLFCFTAASRGTKLVFAPLPLVAQALDIACWWLARWDAAFAWGIVIGGTVAGVGLAVHVVAGVWELACGRCKASDAGATA